MPMTKANIDGLLLKSPKVVLGARTLGDDGPLPGEEFEGMAVALRPDAAGRGIEKQPFNV